MAWVCPAKEKDCLEVYLGAFPDCMKLNHVSIIASAVQALLVPDCVCHWKPAVLDSLPQAWYYAIVYNACLTIETDVQMRQ
eukprot:1160271-Pelagomonas_calceolata.AAC.6